MKKVGIYVHIPFCIKKCLYCDFLSFSNKENKIDNYVNRLTDEISSVPIGVNNENDCDYVVDTVFFGGGTPSLIGPERIHTILCQLRERFSFLTDAEISMEVNPGTVTENDLHRYFLGGINRLSIGLQSACNEELIQLGRIHTYEQFLEAYASARSAGFHNINIDLMSAIPGQNLTSYIETLHKVVQLNPEHISAYSLIVEPNTPFFKMNLPLVNEEEERDMYYQTDKVLKQSGYHRYEISNYAKKDHECRHNIGYWTGKDYLGLGLGSSSKISDYRFKNTSDLDKYLISKECIREEIIQLSVSDQMEEFMYLGLRLTEGIECSRFAELFHKDVSDVYEKVIEKLMRDNLLTYDKRRVVLTDYGRDVSNYVFTHFLIDDKDC